MIKGVKKRPKLSGSHLNELDGVQNCHYGGPLPNQELAFAHPLRNWNVRKWIDYIEKMFNKKITAVVISNNLYFLTIFI